MAIAGGSESEGGIRALCDVREPSSFASSDSVAVSDDAAVEDSRCLVLLGIRSWSGAALGGGGGRKNSSNEY